jgi:hypothetical protein
LMLRPTTDPPLLLAFLATDPPRIDDNELQAGQVFIVNFLQRRLERSWLVMTENGVFTKSMS